MKKYSLIFLAVIIIVVTVLFSWKNQTEPAEIKEVKDDSIKVLFVGDIMLDRGVARHAATYGSESITKGVRDLFVGNDLNVANLEGTITNNPSIALKNHDILRFTFNPDFAKEILTALNIQIVSLANNHALDFYDRGMATTKDFLTTWNISYFGHPLNNLEISYIKNVNDKNICLVGYHQLFQSDPTGVLEEIKNLKPQCFKIVVFTHWGTEYSLKENSTQQELAHKFIDASADLIIGSHPHVVEPLEIYENKAIFYSLGNFIFDQDFSYDTQHGLAVKVAFGEKETRFEFIPLNIITAEASVATSTDRQNILNILNKEGTANLVLYN